MGLLPEEDMPIPQLKRGSSASQPIHDNRYELLAMATAGAFVACAMYWSHVLLGPMLVAALGVSAISWLLPLLFPFALGGLVYLVHRLVTALAGRDPVLGPLFTKHPMIMAALGTGCGAALTTAMALGSAGLAYGGLWIPVVMVAGVYLLSQLAYMGWRWSLGGNATAEQLKNAKSAKTMLLIGSAFNLMAYYSVMFIAPAVVLWTGSAAMVWVVPILFPLLLMIAPSVLNVERASRYIGKKNSAWLKQLKLNPHYTGMVIFATLMPFAMTSAKMLTPIIMAGLGGSAALGLSIVLPVGLAMVAVTLTYVVYKTWQQNWDMRVEKMAESVDDAVTLSSGGVGLGHIDYENKLEFVSQRPAVGTMVLDADVEDDIPVNSPWFLLNN